MSTLIEKLMSWTNKRGMRKNALASLLGVHPSRISKWLDGTGCPDAYQLRRIAEATGLPMDYWTNDAISEPPAPEPPPDPAEMALLLVVRSYGLPHALVLQKLRELALGAVEAEPAPPAPPKPGTQHVRATLRKPPDPPPSGGQAKSKNQRPNSH